MSDYNKAMSFIRGWNYGKANGVELTAREIATQFPDEYEPSFAQGIIDGIEGDKFRLNNVMKRVGGVNIMPRKRSRRAPQPVATMFAE